MINDKTDDDNEFFISRTEQKKSMQIYIRIGEQLLTLNPSQLNTIPLNHELDDALTVAKKIKVGNALKRQMSFIGKLIRNNNHEEIQAALNRLKQQDTLFEHFSQSAEKWLNQFMEEDANVLVNFINQYPQCDRQKLRQLIRNSLKEKQLIQANNNDTRKNASKNKKALFTLLRNTIAENNNQ